MPVMRSPIPRPLHLTLDSHTQYAMFQKYLLTEDELKENDFPRESPHCPGKIIIADNSTFQRWSSRRRCARCKQRYRADKNFENADGKTCFYHPKKLDATSEAYPCCHQAYRSPGCTKGKHHVSAECDLSNAVFKKTRPGHSKFACNVFALDCEMVYTVGGMELAKVGIVGVNGKKLYESFVVPETQILDYNTEYSGVTSDDLISKAVSFSEAQQMVLRFVTEDTILVGHGLENDLRALRLIHRKVVDTSVLFPHERAKYKRSLKSLAVEFLNEDIQSAASGHDCIEDALTAMELVLHKINLDLLSDYSEASFLVAEGEKVLNRLNTPASSEQQSSKLNSSGLSLSDLEDSRFQTKDTSNTRSLWIDCAAEQPSYTHDVRDTRTIADENNGSLVNTSFIPEQSPTLNSFVFDGLSISEWIQGRLEDLHYTDGDETMYPSAMQQVRIQNSCGYCGPKIFGVVYRGEWYPHIMYGSCSCVDA